MMVARNAFAQMRNAKSAMATLLALVCVPLLGALSPFAPAPAHAQNAYITNAVDGTVSVIDTTTNTVATTITVPINATGVAVTPDGSKVYVTDLNGNTVLVIATATNTVVATITVGANPVISSFRRRRIGRGKQRCRRFPFGS